MPRPERRSTATTKVFADRLSDLVEEKKKTGLSQKEIASQIGVSSGTLSEWCSDNKTPMIDALPKLANYFGVTSDWLIGCSDAKARNTTIQTIHHDTGLSDAAITRLMVDQQMRDTPYLAFLNQVIESAHLPDLAALVASYVNIQEGGSLRIDMTPVAEGLGGISIQTAAFVKTLLTEYFFKVIDGK